MTCEKVVTEVIQINEHVTEIRLGDCAFQVFSSLLPVKQKEMVSIDISVNTIDKKGGYGMSGTVYGVVDDKMLISCGGLLAVLDENKNFPPGTFLNLMITKRKKRKANS